MKDLMRIETKDGIETVNARELHSFLGSKQDFSTWIKNRIEKYVFTEDSDYIRFHKKMEANNATRIEYFLSIDMAKELSMVENNEKGREARRWFISIEKKAVALMDDPIITMRMKQLEIEKRMNSLEENVNLLTPETGFYTVTGYCKKQGLRINNETANRAGRKASKMCRDAGIVPGKTNHPLYGQVGTYPEEILDDIFYIG